MQIRVTDDDKPRPSMTPIIDVVFNLLIFFLLASQFAKAERDQSVQVPDVSYVQAVAQMPQSLVVNVTSGGQYSVLNKYYTLEELDGYLASAAAGNENQQVIVRCDGDAMVKYQAAVMDLCNKHKIKGIAITLARKPDGQ